VVVHAHLHVWWAHENLGGMTHNVNHGEHTTTGRSSPTACICGKLRTTAYHGTGQDGQPRLLLVSTLYPAGGTND
jgi:hypothetical protein